MISFLGYVGVILYADQGGLRRYVQQCLLCAKQGEEVVLCSHAESSLHKQLFVLCVIQKERTVLYSHTHGNVNAWLPGARFQLACVRVGRAMFRLPIADWDRKLGIARRGCDILPKVSLSRVGVIRCCPLHAYFQLCTAVPPIVLLPLWP